MLDLAIEIKLSNFKYQKDQVKKNKAKMNEDLAIEITLNNIRYQSGQVKKY